MDYIPKTDLIHGAYYKGQSRIHPLLAYAVILLSIVFSRYTK